MYWNDQMYWHGGEMNGWMFVLVVLALIPLWLALAVGIAAAMRNTARPERGQIPRSGDAPVGGIESRTPTEILALRFANGQLDETEYLRRLAILHRRVDEPGLSAKPHARPDDL
ncbi:SHOCT domain-containing protein [Nocardia aurea]|uniref:SHOCT domain-containing protein n=1 Tax=Nocardia aurea TaxID=2144174 RepID=A0ABV3FS95_9NOCA